MQYPFTVAVVYCMAETKTIYPYHIGMPLYCEMVLVKKLQLEATEFNLKNNNQKVHTPALVYK
jgi:hypothetical protein